MSANSPTISFRSFRNLANVLFMVLKKFMWFGHCHQIIFSIFLSCETSYFFGISYTMSVYFVVATPLTGLSGAL